MTDCDEAKKHAEALAAWQRRGEPSVTLRDVDGTVLPLLAGLSAGQPIEEDTNV
jgi:hypothetical protein